MATRHNLTAHRTPCHQYHRTACLISHNSSNHSRCRFLPLPSLCSLCSLSKPQQIHSANRCYPVVRLVPAHSTVHQRIRLQNTTLDFQHNRSRRSILRPFPCLQFKSHHLLCNSSHNNPSLYSPRLLAQIHSHGNHRHKAPSPHRVDSLCTRRVAPTLSDKVPLSINRQARAGRMQAVKVH